MLLGLVMYLSTYLEVSYSTYSVSRSNTISRIDAAASSVLHLQMVIILLLIVEHTMLVVIATATNSPTQECVHLHY